METRKTKIEKVLKQLNVDFFYVNGQYQIKRNDVGFDLINMVSNLKSSIFYLDTTAVIY